VPFDFSLYPTILFFPTRPFSSFFSVATFSLPHSQALLPLSFSLPSSLPPSLYSFLLSTLPLSTLVPSFFSLLYVLSSISFISFLRSPLSLCPPHLPSGGFTHSLPAWLLMLFQADLSDLGPTFAPRNWYQLPQVSPSPPSSPLLNLQISVCHILTSSVTAVLLPGASSPYQQLTPLLFFFFFSSCLSDLVRLAGGNKICQSTPFHTSYSKSHP